VLLLWLARQRLAGPTQAMCGTTWPNQTWPLHVGTSEGLEIPVNVDNSLLQVLFPDPSTEFTLSVAEGLRSGSGDRPGAGVASAATQLPEADQGLQREGVPGHSQRRRKSHGQRHPGPGGLERDLHRAGETPGHGPGGVARRPRERPDGRIGLGRLSRFPARDLRPDRQPTAPARPGDHHSGHPHENKLGRSGAAPSDRPRTVRLRVLLEDYTNTYGQTEERLAAYELDRTGEPARRIGYLPKDAPRRTGDYLANLHRPLNKKGRRGRIEGQLTPLQEYDAP
jgi:hypothetical protein